MRFHALVLTYDLILCHYSAEDTFVSRWRYVREPLKIFSWVVKGMFVSHWRYVLHEEDFQGIKLWIAHKIKRAELLPRRRYQVFLKTLVSRFRRCRVFYALCAILRDSDFRNGQALPPCKEGGWSDGEPKSVRDYFPIKKPPFETLYNLALALPFLA